MTAVEKNRVVSPPETTLRQVRMTLEACLKSPFSMALIVKSAADASPTPGSIPRSGFFCQPVIK
jgi:hypothetical protein